MRTKIQKVLMLISMLIMVASAGNVSAQVKKSDTIQIKASVICQQCKDRVENGLAFEKGVKDVSVDLELQIVTIIYNPKSTSPDVLRKKLSKLGYNADGIPRDEAAYNKFPSCCKDGTPKH